MKKQPSTPFRWLGATAATLLLAACGSDSDTADSTAPTASTEAPASDPTTAPPGTEPIGTDPPPPDDSGGVDCLVGDWVIADADLADYFDTVAINAAFESIDSTGVIRVTFTDATFEWVNEYSLAMVVDDTSYVGVQSGALVGTYTAADGVLTGTVDDDSRDGTITENGEPLTDDVGDLFVDINPARPFDALPFSCDGPTLTLGAGPMAGSDQVLPLTPA